MLVLCLCCVLEQRCRAVRSCRTRRPSPFRSLCYLDELIPRTLCSPPGTSSIPPHRHRLFVIDHIAQVCQCALELPAVDRLSRFAGIFEGDTEVRAVSAGGFPLLDRGSCVADLDEAEGVSRLV